MGTSHQSLDKGEQRLGWTQWAGTASDWPEDTEWGGGICFFRDIVFGICVKAHGGGNYLALPSQADTK